MEVHFSVEQRTKGFFKPTITYDLIVSVDFTKNEIAYIRAHSKDIFLWWGFDEGFSGHNIRLTLRDLLQGPFRLVGRPSVWLIENQDKASVLKCFSDLKRDMERVPETPLPIPPDESFEL